MRTALDLAAGVPWLITPEALDQLLAIAARERLDLDAVERAHARWETSPEAIALRDMARLDGAAYATVRDGVATVPVRGPMFRYANLMTMLSGATSTQMLARDFQLAIDSPDVRAVVVNYDTPGGQADGIAELAAAMRAARGRKPIVAYVGDWAASAGYWLATAADEIVLSPTGKVGSIGAVMVGSDASMREAQQGVRRTVFRSSVSPLKNPDPGSSAGQAEIQALLDALAERFVAAVAENRGVTVETVIAEFGQGGLVPKPEEAIARGMADRIGSFESLIAELAAAGSNRVIVGAAAAARSKPKMEPITSAAALAAAYPNLVNEIRAAARGPEITADLVARDHPVVATALRAEAVAAERERISKIMGRTLPGHAALRDQAVSSGMAYADFLDAQTAAEQQKGARLLAGLKTDEDKLPKIEASPNAGAAPAAAAGAVDPEAPLEERAKAEWDKSAALRTEFGAFETFLAFRKADEGGQVRILKQ